MKSSASELGLGRSQYANKVGRPFSAPVLVARAHVSFGQRQDTETPSHGADQKTRGLWERDRSCSA